MCKLCGVIVIGVLSGAAYTVGSIAANVLFREKLTEYLSKFNKTKKAQPCM